VSAVSHEQAWDLAPHLVEAALPGRACRSYRALVSTEAAAGDWARAGVPVGAVVVGDYQVSARGLDGRPWQAPLGETLGFSLVLQPRLPYGYEDLLYLAAAVGLLRVAPADARIEWPDRLHAPDWQGRLVTQGEPDGGPLGWWIVSALLHPAPPPRADLLAGAVAAIESAVERAPREVVEEFEAHCSTLGRRVRLRIAPLRPGSPEVVGRAVGCRDNGGLAVETDEGRRAVVTASQLGSIEYLD
jgi:BirA family biotin operon repressor/biotin-[acetyl-CoA-carboxylase] ligase